MKWLSAFKEKSSFWPWALMAESRMWAETGLDGSVWGVRAGKRNTESRDQPEPSGRVSESGFFPVLRFLSWWGLATRKKPLIKMAKYG